MSGLRQITVHFFGSTLVVLVLANPCAQIPPDAIKGSKHNLRRLLSIQAESHYQHERHATGEKPV